MRPVCFTLLLLCLILPLSALGDPLISNGTATAWIGENNWLYLEDDQGTVKYMPTAMADLPAINDTELYCLTSAGSLWSVRLDGSSSSIVSQAPTEDDLAAVMPEARYALENGMLTVFASGQTVPQVIAVCDNGTSLFYITQDDDMSCRLSMTSLAENTIALLSVSRDVKAPLCMYASPDYVTVTAEDHSIQVIDLTSWTLHTFDAVSADTTAAVCHSNQVIRYTRSDMNAWQTETVQSLSDLLSGAASVPEVASRASADATAAPTASPTPAATKAPTATPRSTTVPTKTPKATATEAADTAIYYGDRGSDVKTMQKRLRALGYMEGSADGVFGSDTLTALHLFQFAIGYTERSYASEKCLTRLYASSAPYYDPYLALVRGDHGTPVQLMQLRLAELGYDVGKIDGKYGANTVSAVETFQRTAGLPVDGDCASTEMLMLLYDEEDAPFCPEPTVSPTKEPATKTDL